jgi:hypothetical protein
MATRQHRDSTKHTSGAKGGVSRKANPVGSEKSLHSTSKSRSGGRNASSKATTERSAQTRSAARPDKTSKSSLHPEESNSKSRLSSTRSRISSIGGQIKEAARTLVAKVRRSEPEPHKAESPTASTPAQPTRQTKRPTATTTRVAPTVHRDDAFSPSQRSAKAPFDRNRAEKPRDLESDLMIGMADERFNEEDRYTNKSGDPRIGTHGRSYEREEKRT